MSLLTDHIICIDVTLCLLIFALFNLKFRLKRFRTLFDSARDSKSDACIIKDETAIK